MSEKSILTAVAENGDNTEVGNAIIKYSKNSIVEGNAISHEEGSSEFKINEILSVKNSKSFEVIVKIAQMMTKYEMLDLVVSIDVSDPENVRAYSGNIEVLLGDIKDCDKKIRIMEETLKKIPEGDRGTLDLSDLSKPIIFKYLT